MKSLVIISLFLTLPAFGSECRYEAKDLKHLILKDEKIVSTFDSLEEAMSEMEDQMKAGCEKSKTISRCALTLARDRISLVQRINSNENDVKLFNLNEIVVADKMFRKVVRKGLCEMEKVAPTCVITFSPQYYRYGPADESEYLHPVYLNLQDLVAARELLIKAKACVAAIPTVACEIKEEKGKFILKQGESFVSFDKKTAAEINRDLLVEVKSCKMPPEVPEDDDDAPAKPAAPVPAK